MRWNGMRRFRAYGFAGVMLGCPGGVLLAPRMAMAEPPPAATAAFDGYVAGVEARLVEQHRSSGGFLAPADQAPGATVRLRKGDVLLDAVQSPEGAAGAEGAGAMLHHWRGTAFLPGVSAGEFEGFLRDVDAYPQRFAPEVLGAKQLARNGTGERIWMRVRQTHVIPVVLDETFDVGFGRMDAQHGSSISRSRRIEEMESAGRSALPSSAEHGFLWRLNTYWSYAEGDGGLYVQVESVSLSRSIPQGLAWVLRPYVESVPRESIEFTLRSVRRAFADRGMALREEGTR